MTIKWQSNLIQLPLSTKVASRNAGSHDLHETERQIPEEIVAAENDPNEQTNEQPASELEDNENNNNNNENDEFDIDLSRNNNRRDPNEQANQNFL